MPGSKSVNNTVFRITDCFVYEKNAEYCTTGLCGWRCAAGVTKHYWKLVRRIIFWATHWKCSLNHLFTLIWDTNQNDVIFARKWPAKLPRWSGVWVWATLAWCDTWRWGKTNDNKEPGILLTDEVTALGHSNTHGVVMKISIYLSNIYSPA